MVDDVDLSNDQQQADIDRALSSRCQYQGESAQDCDECGEPINPQRREAVPGVRLCFSCASEAEYRERAR